MKIRNTQHPFAYILKKYIRPLGLTQAQLQNDLHIGSKTLSELYNYKRSLTPLNALKFGKYFGCSPELLMRMQSDYELAKVTAKREDEISMVPNTPQKREVKEQRERTPKTMRVITVINNSIGDRSKHYTEKDIEQVFYTRRFTKKKQYAAMVLFNEVSAQGIIDFVKEKHIPMTRLKQLYDTYRAKFHGTRNPSFEWLFQNLQRSN